MLGYSSFMHVAQTRGDLRLVQQPCQAANLTPPCSAVRQARRNEHVLHEQARRNEHENEQKLLQVHSGGRHSLMARALAGVFTDGKLLQARTC